MMHNNEDWKHDAKKLAEEAIELAGELIKQSNKMGRFFSSL